MKYKRRYESKEVRNKHNVIEQINKRIGKEGMKARM
jgi:hypothetical protein